MCGLVGMAGDFDGKDKSMMKDLLFLDTLRGKDATGLGIVTRKRNLILRKSPIPGYEFVDSFGNTGKMEITDQLWLGHNRFKTVGENTRENAHPFFVFETEDVVSMMGAHNGTISNFYSGMAKHKDLQGWKADTDSETLLSLIDLIGPKKAIAECEGAWSLVWWKASENTLNFLRNKERPMYICMRNDRKVVYWASELWMLKVAASRNGVDLYADPNTKIDYMQTEVDCLYTYSIPQELGTAFQKPKVERGFTGKPVRPFYNNRHGQDSVEQERFWRAVDEEATKNSKAATESSETPEEKRDAKKILTIGKPPEQDNEEIRTELFQNECYGFDKTIITKAYRNSILDKGCVWCGDKNFLDWGWVDHNSVACSDCVKGKHTKQMGLEEQLKVILAI